MHPQHNENDNSIRKKIFSFQADESKIGYIRSELVRLLRKWMGKFVKTAVITSVEELTMVDYKDLRNQHEDNTMAVGIKTRTYLQENEDNMSPSDVKTFFK